MKGSDYSHTGIDRLTQVAQIINCRTNDFYTCEELHDLYNINITDMQYLEIKSAIRRGANDLGINLESCDQQESPRQPVLVSLANVCKKGCQPYYKVLRTKINMKSVTLESEQKWHQKLGVTLSTNFWNNCWRLIAVNKAENKIKWLQTEILKGIVPTMRHVQKFKPNESVLCKFNCGQEETIEHLFFHCQKVKKLWTDLSEFIFPAAVIEVEKLKIIFGNFSNRKINTKENYLILLTKFYIWRERCAKRLPNFIGLKIYIETCLKDLCLNSKFDWPIKLSASYPVS